MRMVKLFFMAALSVVFMTNCTGKEQAKEEKIRITIDRQDEKTKEAAKSPEQPAEKKEPPKKQEQIAREEVPGKEPAPATERFEKRRKMLPQREEYPKEGRMDEHMDFKTVAENLSLDFHTKDEIREYWFKVKGKAVAWKGKVHRVKTGERGVMILVDNPAVKSGKGYNIVLLKKDAEKEFGSVSEGQPIKFRGTLTKFEPGKDGGGPVIILTGAQIL